jgi:putative DNA primase/helicase
LRYHPRTPIGCGRDHAVRPALLAAIRDDHGIQAILRTFLDEPGPGLAKLRDGARRMLGSPAAGAVRLSEASAILGLAEGVETAMSAARILGIPVWASLGSERLARVAIPPIVRHLVLLPDNDRAGAIGATSAAAAFSMPDRKVEVLHPPACFGDWNDLLREEKAVEAWLREAAWRSGATAEGDAP